MARIDDLERGLVDQNGEQVLAELRDGKEFGDPIPKAPPVEMRRVESQADVIRRMVRHQLSLAAQDQGFESFEEAEDFDIDDDPLDPHTPYEAVFDPPPPVMEENDGSSRVDEGRLGAVGGRVGKSGKVGEGKSGAKRPAADQGSPREADSGDSGSEGED